MGKRKVKVTPQENEELVELRAKLRDTSLFALIHDITENDYLEGSFPALQKRWGKNWDKGELVEQYDFINAFCNEGARQVVEESKRIYIPNVGLVCQNARTSRVYITGLAFQALGSKVWFTRSELEARVGIDEVFNYVDILSAWKKLGETPEEYEVRQKARETENNE